MKVEIDIPEYDPRSGTRYTWEPNHVIATSLSEKWESPLFTIAANAAGLKSLARQLLTLAQDSTPSGNYFLYDSDGDLEPGSVTLRISKID